MSVSRYVLTLVTVFGMASCAEADDFKRLTEVNDTVSLDSSEALRVSTNIGKVEVLKSKDDAVHIHAVVKVKGKRLKSVQDLTAFSDHVSIVRDGSVLSISSAHLQAPDKEDWAVSFTIKMPKPLSTEVNLGIGDINVGYASGHMSLSNGIGDINLDVDDASEIIANAGTGKINLKFSQVSGPISASSGTGEVTLRPTGSGPQSDVKLSTGTGSIRLLLPDGYSGRFDASTGLGSIKIHRDCAGLEVTRQGMGAQASGQVGNGSAVYQLNSGVGSIKVECGQ